MITYKKMITHYLEIKRKRVFSVLLAGLLISDALFGAAEQPSADKFRVLFYGQSITAETGWTNEVAKRLEAKYPDIDFEFHNPAIGGFTSPALVRTAEHDLYPWYPDLLIFHVYGPAAPYEDIIRRTLERTTAEIVIQTDHVDVEKADHGIEKLRLEETLERQAIAAKYGAHVADVNTKWRAYLDATGRPAKDFLRDYIHHNADGIKLMADFVFEDIKDLPVFSNRNQTHKTTIGLNDSRVRSLPEGGVELRFEGNRVEVLVTEGIKNCVEFELRVDGELLEDSPDFWQATRPSRIGRPHSLYWMPAIRNVFFNVAPIEEKWTLTVESSESGRMGFRVDGSVTGFDGRGFADQDFVSNSGRVVVESRAWTKRDLPAGKVVTWETYPTFTRSTSDWVVGEYQLLFQGCSNAEHVLAIHPRAGAEVTGIEGFRVLRPSN
ncbi:MAG: hypothetical protein ACI9FZ_001036 [Bacteroidia bacterium]|jgi:hypothetical protein